MANQSSTFSTRLLSTFTMLLLVLTVCTQTSAFKCLQSDAISKNIKESSQAFFSKLCNFASQPNSNPFKLAEQEKPIPVKAKKRRRKNKQKCKKEAEQAVNLASVAETSPEESFHSAEGSAQSTFYEANSSLEEDNDTQDNSLTNNLLTDLESSRAAGTNEPDPMQQQQPEHPNLSAHDSVLPDEHKEILPQLNVKPIVWQANPLVEPLNGPTKVDARQPVAAVVANNKDVWRKGNQQKQNNMEAIPEGKIHRNFADVLRQGIAPPQIVIPTNKVNSPNIGDTWTVVEAKKSPKVNSPIARVETNKHAAQKGLRLKSPETNRFGHIDYCNDSLARAHDDEIIKIYTDASQRWDGLVGIGVWSAVGEEVLFQYGKTLDKQNKKELNTSGYGEVMAALSALKKLKLNTRPEIYKGKQIVVYTDYLALILALQWMPQVCIFCPDVLAIRNIAREFPSGVFFQHITGHAGYVGNLKADELARSAVGLQANPADKPVYEGLKIPTGADCVWKSRKLFIYIPNKNVDSQKKKEQIVNPETFVKIPINFDDILRNDKSNDFKT